MRTEANLPPEMTIEQAWAGARRGDRLAIEHVAREREWARFRHSLRDTTHGRIVRRLILNINMSTEEIGAALRQHANTRAWAVLSLCGFFRKLCNGRKATR